MYTRAVKNEAAKSCVFCSVVSGQSPAHIVLDDAFCVAFLDRTPLFHGHVLVVPRTHCSNLEDLPLDAVGPLFSRVQAIARVLPEALGVEGTFVAINNRVSQSVPHLHIHVVPRKKGDGLKGFFWPRKKYSSEEEMGAIALRIAGRLSDRSAPG